MSVHGICFDNGVAGRCNTECSRFLDMSCEVGSDVIDSITDKEAQELLEDLEGTFRAICLMHVNTNISAHKLIKKALHYE